MIEMPFTCYGFVGNIFFIACTVKPGHVVKNPFLTAFISVYIDGLNAA